MSSGAASKLETMMYLKCCVHTLTLLGKKGKPVEVLTNCFRLSMEDKWLLYQYRVDFSPMVESRRARHAMLRSHSEILDSPMAFDGEILFLLRRLDQPVSGSELVIQ